MHRDTVGPATKLTWSHALGRGAVAAVLVHGVPFPDPLKVPKAPCCFHGGGCLFFFGEMSPKIIHFGLILLMAEIPAPPGMVLKPYK